MKIRRQKLSNKIFPTFYYSTYIFYFIIIQHPITFMMNHFKFYNYNYTTLINRKMKTLYTNPILFHIKLILIIFLKKNQSIRAYILHTIISLLTGRPNLNNFNVLGHFLLFSLLQNIFILIFFLSTCKDTLSGHGVLKSLHFKNRLKKVFQSGENLIFTFETLYFFTIQLY